MNVCDELASPLFLCFRPPNSTPPTAFPERLSLTDGGEDGHGDPSVTGWQGRIDLVRKSRSSVKHLGKVGRPAVWHAMFCVCMCACVRVECDGIV